MPVSYTHLDVYKRQEKMLRIIVEFLTKVGLSIEIKLVKLLQQQQRLILDEFSHVQRCFLSVSYTRLDVYKRQVFCCFVIRDLRASVLSVKPVRGSDIRMVQSCLLYTSRCV